MAYIKGGNYVICDVCGGKFHVGETKLRWDGALVCNGDWEARHPQDFVRGIPDNPAAKITRPEQPDNFVSQAELDSNGIPVISGGQPVLQAVSSSSKDIGNVQYDTDAEDKPSDIVQPRTQPGCPTGTTG